MVSLPVMKKDFLASHKRLLFAVWAASLLLLLGFFFWRAHSGIAVETDILALLPRENGNDEVGEATRQFTAKIGQKTIFLFGHRDFNEAKKNAALFQDIVAKEKSFDSIIFRVDEFGRKLYDFYQDYLPGFLRSRERALLENDPAGFLAERRNLLFNPGSIVSSKILQYDPLLFFQDFMQGVQQFSGRISVRDGVMATQDKEKSYVLVTLQSGRELFSAEVQADLMAALKKGIAAVHAAGTGAEILHAGLLFHAVAGVDSARREISLFGSISIAAIIILLLLAFNSVRPLLLGILPVAYGILAAYCLCVLIFAKIHIITVIFGTSLIGVSIDYSFHYFADKAMTKGAWNPTAGIRNIFPGITLGLVTTILGFLCLFVAPLPALRQMAVFSTAGLLGAYLTVLLALPALMGQAPWSPKTFLLRISAQPVRWARNFHRKPALLILICLVAVAGLGFIRIDDDIRLLRGSSSALSAMEEKITSLLGYSDRSRFFVVTGENVQDVLANESKLVAALDILKSEGGLSGYQALSRLAPPLSEQKQSRSALRKQLIDSGRLNGYMRELGFAQNDIDRALGRFRKNPEKSLDFSIWLESPASQPYRYLWQGKLGKKFASIVPLSDLQDVAALKKATSNLSHAAYVDRVADISDLFRYYRILATILVLVSYGAIFIVLGIRYGRRQAFTVMLPAVAGAFTAIALLALSGQVLNLFNTLALLLILGIGIDYAIFFQEARYEYETVGLATFLSAVTTILSFGLLFFSSTPLLSAFGFTTAIGVGVVYVLSPFIIKFSPEAYEK